MSFRIEEKLLVNKNQLIEFKEYLFKEAKALHKPRSVKSLYFENNNKDLYNDSIEGLVPRKKIRIRTYPDTADKGFYLENKLQCLLYNYSVSKILKQLSMSWYSYHR